MTLLLRIMVIPCLLALSSGVPWWEVSDRQWSDVDPDFSWDKRRTGVTPYWSPGFGIWSHYNASSLLSSSSNNNVEPWTYGRMCKCLREVNETAFELLTAFEPCAVGKWFANTERKEDGLKENGWTFQKTPYRSAPLPGAFVSLPKKRIIEGSDYCDYLRVTIVQPDGATVSGPRWLPTVKDAKMLASLKKQGQWRHCQFCELWLAETVQGCPEGRKMGIYCQYDTISGELLQLICLQEYNLRPTTTLKELEEFDPKGSKIDLDEMQKSIRKSAGYRMEQSMLQSSPAAKALVAGIEMSQVLSLGRFTSFRGRAVYAKEVNGPEKACFIDDEDCNNDYKYNNPFFDKELYLDIRWPHGIYARIPKRLSPGLTAIGFEVGGFTADGDFHRVALFGSRHAGCLHSCVYERLSAAAAAARGGAWWWKRLLQLLPRFGNKR